MTSPSVTYTLSNGATADASQVNQNYTDIINGITDGTKDLSISALTCAGTATLNGHVNLGNASADDLTITASLASTIAIKTTNTYNIGSATLGLAGIYFGTGSTQTARVVAASSFAGALTYTLPDVGVAAKFVLDTMTTPVFIDGSTDAIQLKVQGNGTQTSDILVCEKSDGTDYFTVRGTGDIRSQGALISTSRCLTVSSTSPTITDTDGYDVVLVTTGASQRTVTLPAVATNAGRILTITKVDSGAGTVLIDTPSTETINGSAQNILNAQYSYIKIVCDGTNWFVLEVHDYQNVEKTRAARITLSSGVAADVASFSLSQGVWSLQGSIGFLAGTSALSLQMIGWTSSASATLPASTLYNFGIAYQSLAGGVTESLVASTDERMLCLPHQQIILTAATTYYLSARAGFTVGMEAYGRMWAYRVA